MTMTKSPSSALEAGFSRALVAERAAADAPAGSAPPKQALSGWGRLRVVDASVSTPACLSDVTFPARRTVVCRGEGRSYGDAAVSANGTVLLTRELNALEHFDVTTGVLTAQAGLTIERLLDIVIPRGWFPPVTPGTKHVTLGGAVAADVHGKNHHRVGSLASHIIEMDVMLADGTTVTCGPQQNAELFWATVGGMGLTGLIARVTLQLAPIETSGILAQYYRSPDLETTLTWLADSGHDDHYTVAWVDGLSRGRSLGRSVVMRGHHARRDEMPNPRLAVTATKPLQVPFDFPSFVVNPLSVRAFNQLYYLVEGRKSRPFVVDYERFFYPLDRMADWNRLYGKRGFLQYQFMLPDEGTAGVRVILERISASRRPVFLGVMKRFGPGNPGPLSFPGQGFTLALDFPMTGPDVLRLLDQLDDLVIAYGGRVYLAKDARMSAERFRMMYPRLGEWLRCKEAVDPNGCFSSDLSRRLGLTVGAPALLTV